MARTFALIAPVLRIFVQ